MKRYFFSAILILAIAFSTFTPAALAQDEGPQFDRSANRELPESFAGLKLDTPVEGTGVDFQSIAGSPFFGEGQNRVIIRLANPSVAEQKVRGKAAENAKKFIQAEQASLLDRVLALDPSARIVAQVQVVLNAVFVEVDAAVLAEIANDPAVLHITPVTDYEIDLHETVPHIGGSAVHDTGFTGAGIRVAVLDSGIDYLHAALGGSGDPAEFAANDPNIIEPGTFPTAKVIGGYDFVGSDWLGSGGPPEAPDPDPLDAGPGGGHGTHVAHIIAGVGGVAPDALLYAVKVCSSISTSCSGIALIQGMEFAVDPDGDGDPSDHVDIINMSLGSPYGHPYDDDLSAAVDNATAAGVLTVASAGNSSDKPYVVGTPSAANTALSVAQTAVPSAILPFMEVTSPANLAGFYPIIWQPWSMPLMTVIEAPLQYGNGAGGNLDGCAAFPAGSLAGLAVLVDRGSCNFSAKIKNIGDAGGSVGLIGLIAPGDPFEGGFGGESPITIPGYMISQSISNLLKGGLNAGSVMVRFDPSLGIPLIYTVVGSSSRGPRNPDNLLKPEIGAPGASISAIAGSGTGQGPFGGTSGAAPMVSGSAALLMQAAPGFSPLEVKARLMNTGETNILNGGDGPLAPVSRIGGGEVRVDRAVFAPASAWDDATMQGALSFGFVEVNKDTINLSKTVRVRNYSSSDIEYAITPGFRYADDAATGAVILQAPSKVKVKAGKDATFTFKLTINGAYLLNNYMNSGSMGASPAALTLNEFDGYLVLDDGSKPIHLPWHVLPRKAASLVGTPNLDFVSNPFQVQLTNTGVGAAQIDAYSLLAVSPNLPEGGFGEQMPTPDIRAVGINTFPVPAGFCSADPSFLWAFAINTWERQSHLLPVSHQVSLDIDQDGITDFIVLNRDLSGLSTITDGRQVTWAYNPSTLSASAFFFAEHSANTGNTVLLVCAEQVGLTGADMLSRNVNMSVFAQDFYFGGPGDLVSGLTVTPLGERYFGVPDDIPGKSSGTVQVYDFGPWPGNTPELGLMLFANGDRGAGARGGATQDSEAYLLYAP